MKRIVFGILAHVDAGKTTLSEGLLFASGKIKKIGRVDSRDTILDYMGQERERGITIFSKNAVFEKEDKQFTLLDTPGHIDFQAEMERCLTVLDYAVFVISAAEGVKAQTKEIWKLLQKHRIPTFLFVNKMDRTEKSKEEILREIQESFGTRVVTLPKKWDISEDNEQEIENIVVHDEALLEQFLEEGKIEKEQVKKRIKERILFPCYFGSALKFEGVKEFLSDFSDLTEEYQKKEEFAARVYKITRDEMGNRITHLRLFGGRLKVKEKIKEEKINQIRVYSAGKYEVKEEVEAGEICAVLGLQEVFAGEGLGSLKGEFKHSTDRAVVRYRLELQTEIDSLVFLPKMKQLEEEIPELKVQYNEMKKTISVNLMGEVQKEVITHLMKEKYGQDIKFGEGEVLYKETVAEPSFGFGHFEPLKHYAEVHLKLTPTKRGSGISFDSDLREDMLEVAFQKHILNSLAQKEHKGVLTGAPITDMEIRLIAGKGHLKHTDSGDFREAANRAVRNALMRGKSILLEPVYQFCVEAPESSIGKIMAELISRKATIESPQVYGSVASLSGKIPVAKLGDFNFFLRSVTSGEGSFHVDFGGYEPCHNPEEVIEKANYYPEYDTLNIADSVFCAKGAGFIVPWDEVTHYLHIPFEDKKEEKEEEETLFLRYVKEREKQTGQRREEGIIGREEIDKLIGQAVNSNKKKEEGSARNRWKKRKGEIEKKALSHQSVYQPSNPQKDFLLVDGYNIIFAWEELSKLAEKNIDSARDRLIEILVNYQGYKGNHLILVFDAYKVRGGKESILKEGGIDIIYTREAETADEYIAKASYKLSEEGRVTVASSDSLVQMIIFGSGAFRLSASELKNEVAYTSEKIRETIE